MKLDGRNDVENLDMAQQQNIGSLSAGEAFGQYRVIRLLGRGGMGEVYEAEHMTLGLRYALKLLPAEFASRAGAVEGFRREARVMAQLQHPNIIRVDEFGELNGRYWLRMELAEGFGLSVKGGKEIISLSDYAAALGGRIPQEEMVVVLKEVLAGLGYAHLHGAIHRDLKPANILLNKRRESGSDPELQCQVKISDFGLVRLVGEEWVRTKVQLSVQHSMSMGDQRTLMGSEEGPSTRSMLGTYEYMSPEQKRGEDADERSDLYSLGLMTYKLLTGREVGVKLPSRIDPNLVSAWDDLVAEATESQHDERLASCGQFSELLARVEAQIAAHDGGLNPEEDGAVSRQRIPPPLPKTGRVRELWRSRAVRVSCFALLGIAAVAVAVFVLRPYGKNPDIEESSFSQLSIGTNMTASIMIPSKTVPENEDDPFANMKTAEVAAAKTPVQPVMVAPLIQVPSGATPSSSVQQEPRRLDIGGGVTMTLVWIPPGDFEMGSNESEDAKPVHRVRIGKGFWMGATEVTQAQWEQVMGTNPSNYTGVDLPVERASWNDCQSFLKELNSSYGDNDVKYRFPTEAEWEYAARAGDKSNDAIGGDDVAALRSIWCLSNSGLAPHPVAKKAPNAWGLYDMLGNVWEWCQDWRGPYTKGVATDPIGPVDGSDRVFRGGAWMNNVDACKVFRRSWGSPDTKSSCVGLRVVGEVVE